MNENTQLSTYGSSSSSFRSCHHGDCNHPNNLEYAKRVIDANSSIDIVEIDFITLNNRIVSSHDYNEESIEISGVSSLLEWIDYIVYTKRRFLWIDIKQNTWPVTNSSYFFSDINDKFNAKLFMNELKKIRNRYTSFPYYHKNEVNIVNIDDYHENQRKRMLSLKGKDLPNLTEVVDQASFDIIDYILIGCQDYDLQTELNELNMDKWQMIVDIPYVESYILQHTICFTSLSQSINEEKIKSDFIYNRLNYNNVDWIAIDHSFFKNSNRLVYFITLLKDIYPPGKNLIIYNIDKYIYKLTKSFKPISHLYTIIFQYDYEGEKKMVKTNT